MDYLIIFVFGFITGWLGLRTLVQYRMKQVRDILQAVVEKSQPKEVQVKFSRVGDQIFVHNSDTDEFLGQGSTRAEIVELLEKRYPDIVFRASSANLKEVNLE